jgi:hypothetical protein
MEVIPIISTHNNNSSAHKEEGNKPSEKSVETTASSVTAPSIHYIHDDDCDDTTLNEGHHQHQQVGDHPRSDHKGDVAQQNLHDGDGSGADVLPGYEICISSSSSPSSESLADATTAAATSSAAAANSGEDNMTLQTLHNSNNVSNERVDIKEKKKVPPPKTRPDSPLPNVLRCKEQQQQLASSSSAAAAAAVAAKKKKTEVVPLGPASHIYALRQIIVDYVDDDEKSVQSLSSLVDNEKAEDDDDEENGDGVDYNDDEGDGEGGKTTCITINNENYGKYNDDDDEEDDDDQIFYDAQEHLATTTIPPTTTTTTNTSQARIKKKKRKTTRLISTQMVKLSEEQHVKLEERSLGGTVLCAPSSWTNDDNDGCDRLLSMPSLDEGEGINDDEELKFVDAVDEIIAEEEEEGVVNDDTEVVNSGDGCGCNTPPPRVPSTDDTTAANSSSIEDQVAVVPYCTARRRMGCNCIKGGEGNDSNKKDANEKKKRRRRPFKAAYQQIKRTLFYCRINKKQSNEDTKNEGGEEEFCKECNYFGNNPPSKKGKRKVRHPRPAPHQFRNVGAALYGNEAVINNTAEPSESTSFFLSQHQLDFLSSQYVLYLITCVSCFLSFQSPVQQSQ